MSANTIVISGQYAKEQSRDAAAAGIKPGMLLQIAADGKVAVHATEGGVAEKLVALEDALQGKTVADTYAAGAVVDSALFLPGSRCQVILAKDENVVKGDFLMSAGDGKFKKQTSTHARLFVAMEAKDLSDSLDVDTLIVARAL